MGKENNYKKQIGLLLVVLVVFTITGFFIDYIYVNDINIFGKTISRNIRIIAEPLFFLPIAILLSIAPLIFLKQAVYRAWRKFAVVALPIIILIIAASPEYSSSGFGGPNLGFTREIATLTFSTLFFIISLIIIIVKSIKLRKEKIVPIQKKP